MCTWPLYMASACMALRVSETHHAHPRLQTTPHLYPHPGGTQPSACVLIPDCMLHLDLYHDP